MTSAEADTAIKQHFSDAWNVATTAFPDLVPYAMPNVDFDPPRDPAAPWVRLEIFEGPGGPIALGCGVGTTRERHYGSIVLHIFVPRDSGRHQISALLDRAKGIFDYQQFGGISTGDRHPWTMPNEEEWYGEGFAWDFFYYGTL